VVAVNVKRFIGTAQAYCGLIETGGSLEGSAFFKECFRLVAKLLSEAVGLPDDVGRCGTGRRVTHGEWREIYQRLKLDLGDNDHYKKVFDAWKTEHPEVLLGSISDDLADIWWDVKQGLAVLANDDASNAICEWRLSFLQHWGSFHATGLLHALLPLAFREELEP
jgi:hypothetical protein